MAVFVISYDLTGPNADYDSLHEKIKEFGTWAHVTESTWVVVSGLSATKVRDFVKGAIRGRAKLFVIRLQREAAWYGLSDEVSDWLKDESFEW